MQTPVFLGTTKMDLLVFRRCARSTRMPRAPLAILGLTAILFSPAASSQCFIDSNGVRACPVGPEPGGGSHTSPPSGGLWEDDAEERERAQRNARYNAVHEQAKAAYERQDYREALRLLREQQALRDGPVVRAGIASLERYFVEQANIEQGNRYNQQANSAKEKGDSQQALRLYQQALALYPNPTAEYRQFVADYQKFVEAQTREREARLQREAEAAELERRHRPAVENLRDAARGLIETNPAEALARLDAALQLLPGDPKTSGDRLLAEASLALNAADYDEALAAVKKAEAYAPDAGEVAKWQKRIKEERDRQGAGVQNAFGDSRRRLVGAPGSVDAGAQLKSVDRSSSQALDSPVAERRFLTPGRADRKMAGDGFDTAGADAGTLVHPDKKQYRQRPPSELDKQIPKGAKNDPQIKQMQDWYWSLNGKKSDKERQIAALREQQKTSKDPVLAAKISTLDHDVKRLADDQAKATKTVKERVAVIKKRVLDKGLDWDESPAVDPAASAATVKATTPAAAKLDFIQD